MRSVAALVLRLFGWRLVGEPPAVPRCLVIFAPHTSNWDFPILLLVKLGSGRPVYYLGKHSLFRPPFGWLFRFSGGIPVERGKPNRRVERIVRLFRERSDFWLAISPEGTRARTDHWKSGFYRIAIGAQVPLLLVFIDSATRQCGIGKLLELTGEPELDLARIAEFYRDKRGIEPANASEIRFRA